MWIVIASACIAGGIAYFFTSDDQENYKSTAQLFAGNSRFKAKARQASFSKVDMVDHVEAMKTELIGSMVAYHLLLYDLSESTPFREIGSLPLSAEDLDEAKTKLKEKLSSFEQLSPLDAFENRLVNLVKLKKYDVSNWIVEEDLTIERVRNSDFIKVEFSSENPFLSAFVVNSLCSEFIRYNNFESSSVSSDSLRKLKQLVQQKKEALDNKTEQVNDLKSNIQSPKNTQSRMRSQYESQLRAAEREKERLATSLKAAQTEISNFKSTSPSDNSSRKVKLSELENKINELQRIYQEKGSKDKKLLATIDQFRKQFNAESQRLDDESLKVSEEAREFKDLLTQKERVELAYRNAINRCASLQTSISRLVANNGPKRNNDTSIGLLNQSRDSATKAYNLAAKNYEMANKNASGSNAQMELMIRGQPSAEPESSSDAMLLIILFATGGGIISLGIILIKEGLRSQRTTNYSNLTIVR